MKRKFLLGFQKIFLLQADKMFPTQGYFEVDLKPVTARKCMAIKYVHS